MLFTDFLNTQAVWGRLLQILVEGIATKKAEEIAQEYERDAMAIVEKGNLRDEKAIIDAVLDMVESKQRWDRTEVRVVLTLAGTTRGKVKDKFRASALDRIHDRGVKDPAGIVHATVSIVRGKQGWDTFAAD